MMNHDENEVQAASENYLEGACINDNVVTLRQLQQRRQDLLQKKKHILENMVSKPTFTELAPLVQPVYPAAADDIVVSTATFTTIENDSNYLETTTNDTIGPALDHGSVTIIESLSNENRISFGSDDSVADPSYVVPLSDITNVQPLDSFDVNWFPEREIEPEIASASRTRKRKADRKHWKKNKNQENRMLGKEYTGFKKIDTKYIQNEPKPKRVLGPKCNSPLCLRSKTLYCAELAEEVRQNIFDSFWSMTWKEKKVFVLSMVEKNRKRVSALL